VLIIVLTVAGFGAFQWIENQEHRFLDYPVWHEPYYYLSLRADSMLEPIDTITRRRILDADSSRTAIGPETYQLIPSIKLKMSSINRKI